MKKSLLLFTIFFSGSAFAQSPSLSVNIKMSSAKVGAVQYKIEMKICEPVKKSVVKAYFDNEHSVIDFKALTDSDIVCGKYISTYNAEKEFNEFEYSNQVFAWEKIIVWKITNISSRDLKQPMYLVLPVKIKSFITHIEIKDIEFQTGKVIWFDETGEINASKRQLINLSFKNKKGVALDESTLKGLLD
ncbi:MAG: hypothetical protein WBP16_10215 [Ferruginibacter sp.]